MCCGGKCLFFINLRTGSLIFGYICAIISGLGTIACIGVAMHHEILMMFPPWYYERRSEMLGEFAAAVIIIMGYLAEFLSSFICSTLLLVGITQNKPSLVKTYIIYGMVQVILLLMFFIMLHCFTAFFTSGYVLLAVAFLGLYSMCLYMVFLVYQPMTHEIAFENPPDNSGV